MQKLLCISVLLLSIVTSATSTSLAVFKSNGPIEIYQGQLVETGPFSNPLDYVIAVNAYYTLNIVGISLTNQTQGAGYLIINPSIENIQYRVFSIGQDGSLLFKNLNSDIQYVNITVKPTSFENATSITFTPYLIKGEAPNLHFGSTIGVSMGTILLVLITIVVTVVLISSLRKKKTNNEVQANERLTLVENQP